ncbi:FUSC family protein [Streptomyces sp. NPDC090112]|uniref:FUSC family protein n=1 Tax=Streptomyces sp. NPDC090112 TaxID=3365949 RepID=UPI00382B3F07
MPDLSGSYAAVRTFSPGPRFRSAARLAVCAAVPWYLCLWWGTSTLPVPAALPAVLILRDDVYAAPRLARERIAGVAAGVVLSTLVLRWLPPSSLSFLAVLVCGCAGMYLLNRGGSPNQQVLITALVVYATALPGYPLARLLESAVGVAVVVLLGPLLWPPDPYRAAAEGLEAYRSGVGALLEGVAARLARGGPPAGPERSPEEAPPWSAPQDCRARFDLAEAQVRALFRPFAPFGPLRRRAVRPPAGLRARLTLATRTSLTLRYFTEELRERERAGTGSCGAAGAATADPALHDLAPLVRATADAVDRALRGADFTAELRLARGLDRAHREAHPTRHEAVLRAGLHLTHEALADHQGASGA